MEMASIGFLLGAVVAVIFVGIGVCFGDYRHNRQVFGDDPDINVYVPMRYRNRSGLGVHNEFNTEEIKNVLNAVLIDYKTKLTPYERNVLCYLIDNLKEDGE